VSNPRGPRRVNEHRFKLRLVGAGGRQQESALDFISDKWTSLIIRELAGGTKRHSQLQRAIGGISQKILTQTLRTLERNGLVERTIYPVVPPMVEYALTPLGVTLVEVLTSVVTWAEEHLPDVERARAKHDGAA